MRARSVLALTAAGGSPIYGATPLARYGAAKTVSLLRLGMMWRRPGSLRPGPDRSAA